MLGKFKTLLNREKKLIEQKLVIDQLQQKVDRLEHNNQRIRNAMRHCTTCDYRLEAKAIRRKAEIEITRP